jgi:hypothetical protein
MNRVTHYYFKRNNNGTLYRQAKAATLTAIISLDSTLSELETETFTLDTVNERGAVVIFKPSASKLFSSAGTVRSRILKGVCLTDSAISLRTSKNSQVLTRDCDIGSVQVNCMFLCLLVFA